jgi:Holliday junction resolvase RusA-like endonuclease
MPDPFALVVTLKGRPYALPRARHIPGRRRPVSLTGPAKVYAQALQRAARAVVLNVGVERVQQEFAGGALAVSVLWVFPTPKAERWGKPHTLRPDKDNLEKMALDCLERAGGLGGNDCRVAVGRQVKQWGPEGWAAIRVELVELAETSHVRKAIKDRLSAPPGWLRG